MIKAQDASFISQILIKVILCSSPGEEVVNGRDEISDHFELRMQYGKNWTNHLTHKL